MSSQQDRSVFGRYSFSLSLMTTALVGAAAFLNLAVPQDAHSQIDSKVVKPPVFTGDSTPHVTRAKLPKAPVQVEMPTPPPMKIVPGMEEVVVATGPVSDQESKDLDAAIQEFHDSPAKAGQGGDYDDYSKPILAFIAAHPGSNWNAALHTNLGFGFYHGGYYSRAFTEFEQAWRLGREATSVPAHLVVDRAVGELAKMHARVGHATELEALLKDIGKRPIGGPATETIQGAREGLWIFHHDVGVAYLCGPKALGNVLKTLKASAKQIEVADEARSGEHGFTLEQVAALADKAKLKYTLVHRKQGQPIPVPSIINWSLHHYAAITGRDNDSGAYIVQDPTFDHGGSLLTPKAIDAEGSGYFLVPDAVMKANPNAGWEKVSAHSAEARAVYGMGSAATSTAGCTYGCGINNSPGDANADTQARGAGDTVPAQFPNSQPMSVASAHAMVVSLNLTDTPVGYRPQVGSTPATTAIRYNQREAELPATFGFSNLSPKWSHGWLDYVQDTPGVGATPPTHVTPGGGGIEYPVGYVNHTTYGSYIPESLNNATLNRYPLAGNLPVVKLVRVQPDGTQEIYDKFDGATTYPRRIFLTSVIDPSGNTTTLNYDSSLRLTSVVDPMGRSTTFTYGLTSYPLLITQITDGFGRSTQLTYDTSQRLSTLTDPAGITSTYTYSSTEPSFITNLTTPYGTSTFNDTPNPNDTVETNTRSLTVSSPLGNTDFLYYYQNPSIIPATDPTSTLPAGMTVTNNYLNIRDTYYWNPHAFALGVTTSGGVVQSEDFTKAVNTHWIHRSQFVSAFDVPESLKRPLENRIWYNYFKQPNPTNSGTLDYVTNQGRVLDDGSTQLSTFSYTETNGHRKSAFDPVGRKTKFNYATNDIDLLTVQQLTSGTTTYTTVATFGSYNAAHQPQTYTGADGQTWHYTYNTVGQLKTVTDPNSNVTTYNYDTTGRLSTIVDANSQTVLTNTYDSADRVQTRTDSQGYTLTYAYDNLDRVTSITYPDGTTDQYDYNFQSGPHVGTASLELRKYTDRLGRVTTYDYDADRRLISVTEPTSGSSTRTTQYSYYEDGTLKEITDANGNVTHWNIDIESRPTSKTYAYGTGSAQTEIYTYENTTSRLKSITDALGQVKTFTYANDDRITGITYTSTVNPTPSVSFAWDTYFPRVSSMTDGLGTTNYAYTAIGSNGALKLSSIDGPYSNDTIGLTYDAIGRLSGRNITGGNETFGYDAINRLTSHGTPLGSFTLGYLGETGQLTSQSVTNGSVTVATNWGYDTNANDRRLTSITNSGVSRSYTLGYGSGPVNVYDIMSITDTAATGHPWATQSHGYTYDRVDRLLTASATTPGNSTFAYDNLDNTTTWNTPASGSLSPTFNGLNQLATFGTSTYSYDANGNTLSGDGTKTYKWDAENRLVEIDYVGTSNKSVFNYDGVGHRISDAETVSGTTTTTRYLWCGSRICQSRDGSDNVLKRYLNEGEYNLATSQKLIYMPDQLGSVRDAVDATTGTRVASYDYTPYGAVARSSVTNGTDYIYGGLMAHPASGLLMSTTRFYDPATGRWPTRDPIREAAGPNLYSYVDAAPIMFGDRTGLAKWDDPRLNNPAFTNPIFQGHRTYTPPTCDDPVSIWTCTRGLGGQQGNIPYVCPACHEFVACTDPNNPPNGLPWKTQAFGKQPRALNPDGSSPAGSSTSGPGYVSPEQYGGQPGNFSHCTERKVCPSEQQRQCHAGPTQDPYETGSSVLNCQGWAEGRSQ